MGPIKGFNGCHDGRVIDFSVTSKGSFRSLIRADCLSKGICEDKKGQGRFVFCGTKQREWYFMSYTKKWYAYAVNRAFGKLSVL